MELYPGVKISIGPPIENGFYYDFDFPEGVTISDADFERIEAKMREHIKADEPFVREEVPVGEALERFLAEGQDYKVELIEDLVSDQGVDRLAVHERPVHRPLPRAARAEHEADQGVQAAVGRRRLLARGRSQPMLTRMYGTAFFSKQGARGAPRAARAGARARPPPPRPRARPVPRSPSWRPGPRSGPGGHDGVERARRPRARDEGRARLHEVKTPHALRRSRCGRPRGTGRSTATTCS